LRLWDHCPPAAWLGLSQLHTLRGVSLVDVPAAAIAAALPQLHTLHLYQESRVEFPVAAFFDELLPRLRSFHLEGRWPKTKLGTEMADILPLPRLEDLKWRSWGMCLPRGFVGARPSTLDTSEVPLTAWLQVADGANPDPPTVTSPLARVRVLTLSLGPTPPEAPLMALLLREAPQLRQLTFRGHVSADLRWVVEDTFAPAGVVHQRLRHVAVTGEYPDRDVSVPRGCGVRLRERHFPRLRRLTVDDQEYPV
jgi:hypothetical protein